jgi:hypothetical protein
MGAMRGVGSGRDRSSPSPQVADGPAPQQRITLIPAHAGTQIIRRGEKKNWHEEHEESEDTKKRKKARTRPAMK